MAFGGRGLIRGMVSVGGATVIGWKELLHLFLFVKVIILTSMSLLQNLCRTAPLEDKYMAPWECTIKPLPGTLVSSTNKTDRYDLTEILLNVALNTINQTNGMLF